jgi:formate hydrogenlyase subunit 6/NADH:ubiquinone oxidoreductase subunit I
MFRRKKENPEIGVAPQSMEAGLSRRAFLSIASLFTLTTVVKAQTKKVEGGLAIIKNRNLPARSGEITPPGSQGIRNFERHCSFCHLCVSVCPNQVLTPSASSGHLMLPLLSYSRGFCRPECVKCSEVCPTGAIRRIKPPEKSSIQIGHAVWIQKNCVNFTDHVSCDSCARHCSSGAIQMISSEEGNPSSLKMPLVNTERCIGCGACEYLCPARPFGAIYVEGHEKHRKV